MLTGRNDPCPCGSGKKYKKCCLSKAYIEKGEGREDIIRARVVQDLLKFFNQNFADSLADARDIFWNDFVPEEHLDDTTLPLADTNFWEWVVHDFLIDEEDEKTLIDLYLESGSRISIDEHRVLSMMNNSVISLYEVQEVFPEKGLLLKDLLLGGEYDVREKAATRSARKWDIFATRLLYVDGVYIMSGAVYPYHLKQKAWILKDIHASFEDYKEDFPDDALDVFLKTNSDLFNYHWYYPVLNPPKLDFATTTGEPMLFSKAIFRIKDKKVVINGLQKVKEFEQDKDGFIWLAKQKKDGGRTVLGNIEIKGDKLILACNSKKRLEKGKNLIIRNTADAVIHKADTFQDPVEAVKSLKDSPPDDTEDHIPMEVKQRIYSQFMQGHCEKWLNDKIPALDGKTPRQAVKSADGIRMVIELLKSFENIEEHNKHEGRPFYDLSWMWDRLGLQRDR
ncbi:MAG: SEC-C domain-containing protein [Nitrospirae bacterium]|nr:SEC-C domain-containing protein [Nitrospirota bacterium]